MSEFIQGFLAAAAWLCDVESVFKKVGLDISAAIDLLYVDDEPCVGHLKTVYQLYPLRRMQSACGQYRLEWGVDVSADADGVDEDDGMLVGAENRP